jgi:broad specificity phosphatase PhoE
VIEQLILVRHGETEHNVAGIVQGWSDSELSERGRQQVVRLAERLKTFEADAIFSSPLQRAMTTAQRIAGATGLEVRTLDGLREMNYGRWEGQSFLDIRKTDESIYRRWVADSSFACPEGESHDDVLARIRGALDSLNGAKCPIVVAHGTAIRIAATALLDLPLSASRSFAQDNTAVNVFLRRGGRWVMKLWNDTTHCDER